jgi:methyl-accepting chemotaxis protein
MKLGVGFGTLLLILVVVGVVSYASLQKTVELSIMAGDKDRAVIILRTIEARINDQKAEVRGFLDDSRQEELDRYANNTRILADNLSQLESLILTDKGKQMLAQIREGSEGYGRAMAQVIELQRLGKPKEAVQLLYQAQTVALRDQTAKAVTALIERGEELAASTRQDQKAAESRAVTLLLAFVIAGLIVGFAMTLYIARNITGRVSQMVAMIEAIAGDDLSREDMLIRNRDEIGTAGTLLNSMKNNLKAIVQSIAATAEHVASASEEISASATEMANGSETRKDQVHQVATAMQEMSATVHEVSESCNKAAESAHQTAETAR